MSILQAPDLDACHYEQNSKPQYQNVQKLLEGITIDSSYSILDVGCGYGNIIAELSQKAPNGRSIGIDASANMIKHAVNKFPELIYPNLEFYHMKAEKISFPNIYFDFILCTNSLLWVRNPKKALELMCKSLKQGGSLVILTYLNSTPYSFLFKEVLEKYFNSYKKYSAVKTMLSKKAHQQILMNNGMSLEVFSSEKVIFEYKNKNEFVDYVKGWLSCYVSLPSELQNLFLEKIIEESVHYNVSKIKGEIAIPHESLAIKAKKL